jgi:hypothetical protein
VQGPLRAIVKIHGAGGQLDGIDGHCHKTNLISNFHFEIALAAAGADARRLRRLSSAYFYK